MIGDSRRILRWRGIDGDGADYALACAAIDRSNLSALDESLITWDFGGPGTGFIMPHPRGFDFVRVWADDELDDSMIRRLSAEASFRATHLKIAVSSGILVFLWATEPGISITSFDEKSGIAVGDFSMGGVSHFERVECGDFAVQIAQGDDEHLAFTAIRIQKG